jgi:hypothetical protein
MVLKVKPPAIRCSLESLQPFVDSLLWHNKCGFFHLSEISTGNLTPKTAHYMIIHSGLGFFPIIFVVLFGFFFYNNNPRAWSASDKPFAFTLILTGIASGLLGYFLRRRPERTLVDKATGKELKFRASHSLFFIPMVYWAPIFITWALYLIVCGR